MVYAWHFVMAVKKCYHNDQQLQKKKVLENLLHKKDIGSQPFSKHINVMWDSPLYSVNIFLPLVIKETALAYDRAE